jgi:hypothetical protein
MRNAQLSIGIYTCLRRTYERCIDIGSCARSHPTTDEVVSRTSYLSNRRRRSSVGHADNALVRTRRCSHFLFCYLGQTYRQRERGSCSRSTTRHIANETDPKRCPTRDKRTLTDCAVGHILIRHRTWLCCRLRRANERTVDRGICFDFHWFRVDVQRRRECSIICSTSAVPLTDRRR